MTRAVRRVWNRLLGSLFGNRREEDFATELDSHIQLLTEENMRRGLPPEEARRRARLQFGSVESTKESYRDQRGLSFLDTTAQDLRYAFRGVRRNPGFATVAILSLAIGIGANIAIFSLVNAVLLQPLAFKDPRRVFVVREVTPQFSGRRSMPVNPVHAREWAKECPSIEDVALMRSSRADIASGGDPVSVPGANVAHNLFKLFGVEPILGRTFLPEEEKEGNDRVVILSESLWRSRFNADPSLVGKSILLDRESHEVVGVIPTWFRLPVPVGLEVTAAKVRFEYFRPLVISQQELSRIMGNFNYGAVARLGRNATAEQALAEINVVQSRFQALAGSKEDLKARLIPVQELVTGRARLGLWMLAAAVGAVLLIVCINLANLLLSRIASRSREAAIRTALGASRGRQFRQVLTENLLLAVSGGALGVLFANWGIQLLVGTTTLDIPRLDEIRLDFHVLAFACCLTLLTGILFGALPAWHFTRNDPQAALRAGSHTVTEGRRGMRLREALIGLEVGLSAALLIVAGLLTSSLTRLLEVDKGFDAGRVLTTGIGLGGPLYGESANRERFLDRLLAKLSAIPGVDDSGFVTALPMSGESFNDAIYLEDDGPRRSERHPVNNRYASPGYFRAMNIAVRQGRAFDESDRGRGVAVLSEKAAKLLWPGEANPVGRRFVGEDNKAKTLVGIVADVRADLQKDATPTAYYPWWQRVPVFGALVVRTTASPHTAASAIRGAIRSEDPQLPIREFRTMEEVVDRSIAERKFQFTLMGAFAVSALLVASLGIYGVVSYSVIRRRNEIGIRMALGARHSRLLGLVIRQGMTPVAIGLTAGVAFALFLGRSIRGLLFEVQPADPVTIAGVIAVLLLVGALACFVPARRAAGDEAVAALRSE
jgi:predicted permease